MNISTCRVALRFVLVTKTVQLFTFICLLSGGAFCDLGFFSSASHIFKIQIDMKQSVLNIQH